MASGLDTGCNETLGWMKQCPGLVTLIPWLWGVPSRDTPGERHFPIQVQAICQEWKNNFKQPPSIHSAFGIRAWLSTVGSNACQPCCFFPFWITSNNYLRDIKALSTAHKILWQLTEQGFLDPVDGSTLLCLASGPESSSLPSYTPWLRRLFLCASSGTTYTGLWIAKICLCFQHTQMHMDPPPWGPLCVYVPSAAEFLSYQPLRCCYKRSIGWILWSGIFIGQH